MKSSSVNWSMVFVWFFNILLFGRRVIGSIYNYDFVSRFITVQFILLYIFLLYSTNSYRMDSLRYNKVVSFCLIIFSGIV